MNSKCSAYISSTLNEVLGEGFTCVEQTRAMQMRLFVFVNNRTLDASKAAIKAMAIQKENENTGLGHFLGNKGGQCITLTLNGTSLCFVSCHLSAHEGGKHLADRNSDCREIMSGVDVGQKGLDLGSQFHHCFWMGDMNYRVDLGTVEEYHHLAAGDGKDKKTLQTQKFEIVSDLVTKLDGPDRESALATLHAADELSGAMARKDVLVGFEELPGLPTFHPTFKVHRWEPEKFVVKRTPSYCDRILVKSLPGFKRNVEAIAYESCPTFVSSDHKPIRAGYSLKQPVRTIKGGSSRFTVTVSDITVKVEGRAASKQDVPDMYVKLLADPVNVIKGRSGKDVRTKQVANTTEHTFADNLTALLHAEEADLGNAHLIFSVMDKDVGSADDPLGSVSLCCGELIPMVKYTVDESLVLNGLLGGTFQCSVLLAPVSPDEADAGTGGCCTIL